MMQAQVAKMQQAMQMQQGVGAAGLPMPWDGGSAGAGHSVSTPALFPSAETLHASDSSATRASPDFRSLSSLCPSSPPARLFPVPVTVLRRFCWRNS